MPVVCMCPIGVEPLAGEKNVLSKKCSQKIIASYRSELVFVYVSAGAHSLCLQEQLSSVEFYWLKPSDTELCEAIDIVTF